MEDWIIYIYVVYIHTTQCNQEVSRNFPAQLLCRLIQISSPGTSDTHCLWILTSHPIDSLSFHLCSVASIHNALQKAKQLFACGIYDIISSTPTTAEIPFHQLAWIWRGNESHILEKWDWFCMLQLMLMQKKKKRRKEKNQTSHGDILWWSIHNYQSQKVTIEPVGLVNFINFDDSHRACFLIC